MYTSDQIKSMARKASISLRGNKDDVDQFNGYNFDPYRYVAIKNGEMFTGIETGNFLPVNVETYTIITRHDKAQDVINRLLLNLSV